MTAITERAQIERLAAGFTRSPLQLNALHESDAELVGLQNGYILAITTDTIAEEIATGLYRDPYLAGWMIVTVNASDLAAVGAEPLGIVVSESIPPTMPEVDVRALQHGIRDAAQRHRLHVLGGDTNASVTLVLGGTAVGTIAGAAPLTRRGARPGDRLYASGPLGIGTAFAFVTLLGDAHERGATIPFQPIGRLQEGSCLPGIATACMDTSDGVIATLDELMRLNDVGVSWERSLSEVLHPAALATARRGGLPEWTMLAGPHGEFELLFSVPPSQRDALNEVAAAIGWNPLELGLVTEEPGCCRYDGTERLEVDTARIRNLLGEVGGDPLRYMCELLGAAAPRAADSVGPVA
jgi:thiamine-monophosphate kinase